MNKKILIIIVGTLLITLGVIFQQKIKRTPAAPYTTKISVGNKNVWVETVSSKETMAQGLSGREKLLENQGMLFNYGSGANITPGFWMPDMKFNIDIIWIKENKIIGITKNVPTPIQNSKSEMKNLPVYYPPSPVDMVLEVNAEWSEGVSVGESVVINF